MAWPSVPVVRTVSGERNVHWVRDEVVYVPLERRVCLGSGVEGVGER